MLMSPVARSLWARCALLLAWLAVAAIWIGRQEESAAAPPNRRPPKLPDLKTPEEKLRYIGMIRQEFPVMKRTSMFQPEDLDKHLGPCPGPVGAPARPAGREAPRDDPQVRG